MSIPYVQVDINKSVGALLVGTWANSMLFSIELVQMWQYFSQNRNGWGLLRCSMVFLLLVDTVSSISDFSCVYSYTVLNWGNVTYLEKQYWQLACNLITTGLSACIVQVFLLSRSHKLSKSWPVTIILCGAVATSLGGSLAAGIQVIRYPSFRDRNHAVVFVTIWLCSSAVADVLIALAIVFFLARMRKTAAEFEQSRLTGGLKRLIVLVVETGSLTAGLAVLTFIVYISDLSANIAIGFAYGLGRVYSLTMLANLNAGRNIARRTAAEDNARSAADNTRSRKTALASIQVSHSATIQIEDDRDDIQLDRLAPLTKKKLTFGGLRKGSELKTFAIGTNDIRDEKIAYNIDVDHV